MSSKTVNNLFCNIYRSLHHAYRHCTPITSFTFYYKYELAYNDIASHLEITIICKFVRIYYTHYYY